MVKRDTTQSLQHILENLTIYNPNSHHESENRQIIALQGTYRIPTLPSLDHLGQIQIVRKSNTLYQLYPLAEPKPLTIHPASPPVEEYTQWPMSEPPQIRPFPKHSALQAYFSTHPTPYEEHTLFVEGPFSTRSSGVECALREYITKRNGKEHKTTLTQTVVLYLTGEGTICNPLSTGTPQTDWNDIGRRKL